MTATLVLCIVLCIAWLLLAHYLTKRELFASGDRAEINARLSRLRWESPDMAHADPSPPPVLLLVILVAVMGYALSIVIIALFGR